MSKEIKNILIVDDEEIVRTSCIRSLKPKGYEVTVAPDAEEGLRLINENSFGNGTSIFTSSGGAARKFQSEIEVGQVGINIPIPVPLPFFSFTGWKNSFYGDHHPYGKQAVRFYTETKTITARWFSSDAVVSDNMTIALK